MAGFDVTVDGACKGTPEDVATMKTQLAALLDNQDKLDDPDWLRELFGEEIDDLVDLDDEDAVSDMFSGFRIKWWGNRFRINGSVDTDNLQFRGTPTEKHNKTGGTELNAFFSAIKGVFPRVEFHFISWCYISWGHYLIFAEGAEGEEAEKAYGWDEEDEGEEKKDVYVEWRLAYRDLWLLDDDATDAERAAAQEAADDAEAAFKLRLLPSGDEDEDEEEKSYDDWLAAVGENGWELGRAPEEMRTVELCAKAFSVGKSGLILRFVPETMRAQVCLAAVQGRGSALQYVPESLRTAEICRAAVQQQGLALQYVPESLRTAEICRAAIQGRGRALKYVLEALQEPVKKVAETKESDSIVLKFDSQEDAEEAGKYINNMAAANDLKKLFEDKDFYNSLLELVPEEERAETGAELRRRFASEEDDNDEDGEDPVELSGMAVQFRDEGRYEEALRLHDKIVQLRPEDAAAWSGRGWTYYLKGDYEKALADMDEALRLAPGSENREDRRLQIADKLEEQGKQAADFNYSPKTLFYAGKKYRKQGEFEKSLKAYGKALQQLGNDPEATIIYNARAYTYKAMGRFEEAIADLNTALALKPDGFAVNGINLYKNRAEMYEAAGEYQKAAADARKALDLLGNNPTATNLYNFRAYTYKAMGRFEEAIADLNTALALKPDGFAEDGCNLYDSRAEMYEAAGEYQKAAADARKALEIEPDSESSKEILARCEAALQEQRRREKTKNTLKNTGRLCSVYCPGCGKVTQKVSFNLLREAGTVKVTCPVCLNATIITYDGKTAELTWLPLSPRKAKVKKERSPLS